MVGPQGQQQVLTGEKTVGSGTPEANGHQGQQIVEGYDFIKKIFGLFDLGQGGKFTVEGAAGIVVEIERTFQQQAPQNSQAGFAPEAKGQAGFCKPGRLPPPVGLPFDMHGASVANPKQVP